MWLYLQINDETGKVLLSQTKDSKKFQFEDQSLLYSIPTALALKNFGSAYIAGNNGDIIFKMFEKNKNSLVIILIITNQIGASTDNFIKYSKLLDLIYNILFMNIGMSLHQMQTLNKDTSGKDFKVINNRLSK